MLLKRGNSLTLEKMRMDTAATEAGLPFVVALDSRCDSVVIDYNAATGNSRYFVRGYDQYSPNQAVLMTGPNKFRDYPVLEFSPTGGGFIATIKGNHAGQRVFSGSPYSSSYTLTDTFYRQQNGNQTQVLQDGRLQIGSYDFVYDTTAYFKVMIDTDGRDPVFHEFLRWRHREPQDHPGEPPDGRWALHGAGRERQPQGQDRHPERHLETLQHPLRHLERHLEPLNTKWISMGIPPAGDRSRPH